MRILVIFLCSLPRAFSTTSCLDLDLSSNWLESRGLASSSTGLLVSFDAPASRTWATDRGYSYDQAVAVIAWLLSNQPNVTNSHNLLYSMSSLFEWTDGSDDGSHNASRIAVPFYWDTETGSASSLYRTGNHAWVTYAFALYELTTASTEFSNELNALCYWLLDRISSDNSCLVGGPSVTWCSTEHNIDAFFALHLTSWLRSTSNPEMSNHFYVGAHVAGSALFNDLWNDAGERFNQGQGDTFVALDAQTWGALYLLGIDNNLVTNFSNGEANVVERASSSLAFATTSCRSTQRSILDDQISTGYSPYIDPDGNGGDAGGGCVWSEGTYGGAMAFARFNSSSDHDYESLLTGLNPLVDNLTGSVLYAANVSTVSSWGDVFYPFPSVACTGWRLLACSSEALSSFWNATTDNYNFLNNKFQRAPSSTPTMNPTSSPSLLPTMIPSPLPTNLPTSSPSLLPTSLPLPNPSMIPTITPSLTPTTIDTITVSVGFELTSTSIPDSNDKSELKNIIANSLNISDSFIKNFLLNYSLVSRRKLLSSFLWTTSFEVMISLALTDSSSTSSFSSFISTTLSSTSFTNSVLSSTGSIVDTSSISTVFTTMIPSSLPTIAPTSSNSNPNKTNKKSNSIVGVEQATFTIILIVVVFITIIIFGMVLYKTSQASSSKTNSNENENENNNDSGAAIVHINAKRESFNYFRDKDYTCSTRKRIKVLSFWYRKS